MAKVSATVVMVTALAGVSPAIEPQVDAPCVIPVSACPVPTPTAADHPHHTASTVVPFDPVIGLVPVTDVAALTLSETATVTVVHSG